jgi:hypothetical protein
VCVRVFACVCVCVCVCMHLRITNALCRIFGKFCTSKLGKFLTKKKQGENKKARGKHTLKLRGKCEVGKSALLANVGHHLRCVFITAVPSTKLFARSLLTHNRFLLTHNSSLLTHIRSLLTVMMMSCIVCVCVYYCSTYYKAVRGGCLSVFYLF